MGLFVTGIILVNIIKIGWLMHQAWVSGIDYLAAGVIDLDNIEKLVYVGYIHVIIHVLDLYHKCC